MFENEIERGDPDGPTGDRNEGSFSFLDYLMLLVHKLF